MDTSTAHTAHGAERTWRLPRLLLEDHIALALMIWAGFVVTVMGVAVGISYFSDVTGSVWEPASNFAYWYVAFLTGYVAHQSVPLFIVHGRTRRDSAIELVVFMIAFSAIDAALIAIGYLIEFGFYGLVGWPRDMTGDHLFASHGDVPVIFAEYWLTFLVWAVAGGLVGAAFYRYDSSGWFALVPAAILVGLGEIGSGPQFMGFVLERLPSIDASSLPVFAVIAIPCFLAGLAMTWPIVRDMPIRNR